MPVLSWLAVISHIMQKAEGKLFHNHFIAFQFHSSEKLAYLSINTEIQPTDAIENNLSPKRADSSLIVHDFMKQSESIGSTQCCIYI